MVDVIVVSREWLTARMICLEMEKLGLQAEALTAIPHNCNAALVIADYDGLTKEERARCASPIGQQCYLLYGEEEIPANAGIVRLERPFSVQELVLAVGEHLLSPPAPMTVTQISFRVTAAGVLIDDHLLSLTKKEEAILLFLLAHRGEVVTRETLCRAIWGERPPRNNSLEVYIGRLRRKAEQISGRRVIASVHGIGYRID